MVIFGGHVTGKGTNALHELHINVTYDLSKKKVKVARTRLLSVFRD